MLKYYWTVFNIDNNNKKKSWSSNQHVKMISEASCDTEDWSNDAENSALITGINYILKCIEIEMSCFKLYLHLTILQYF